MFKFKIHGIEAHSANCAISGANAILESLKKCAKQNVAIVLEIN